MFRVPEKYRDLKTPGYKSTWHDGNNGVFRIPHFRISDYIIFAMASDGLGWEHVSVSISKVRQQPHRCPTWEEMCWVKDLFWSKDETVLQYHPAEDQYVNMHPFVLHLWKPQIEFPKPLKEMIGI